MLTRIVVLVVLARLCVLPSTHDSTSGIWRLLMSDTLLSLRGVKCGSAFVFTLFHILLSTLRQTQCLRDFCVPPGVVVT